MMTLQQTITIPNATKRLTVDLPEAIPAGTVDVVLFFPTPAAEQKPKQTKNRLTQEESHAKLNGMFKGSTYTVDKFLEERHAETRREEEEFQRMFHKK